MKSVDGTEKNIEKIAELFPNVITEARDANGKVIRAVDFDLLKQELSYILVEGDKERYQLTWPGKKEAIVNANTPIDKTLRPIKEDSVNWDDTQNLYIEGDNLEVLKLLQESYLNKVKCIYIDPPYNTGNDFVYKDDFKETLKGYLGNSGQLDEVDNRLFQNTETNGRFHSDWLTMMYARLKITRNLLREDGVVFISIDDNEVDNLKKMCSEIFGGNNFIVSICHKSRASVSNDKIISSNHNHILLYCKNLNRVFSNRSNIGLDPDLNGFSNPDNDPRGEYKLTPVDGPGGARKGNPYYEFLGVEGYFRYSKETMEAKYREGLIVKSRNGLQQKYYLNQAMKTRKTDVSWWDDAGLTSNATKDLDKLLGGKFFDNPKPVSLLLRMLKLFTYYDKDSIVMDFFSGSATTAHAVMHLNAEDGGNRKYIMVQLPEETDEKSEAYKAGYKNICEIGKERIRRAAKKIKEETNADIDYGFRVFRLDSSNMKDVYYTPDKLGQADMDDLTSNIKEERTSEDLLTQVMLECGLELSLPMETKQVEGKTVIYVAGNSLIVCFDEDISECAIEEIAKDQPLRVVFRDHSFKDDSARINVEERFKMLSPNTEIQVL